MCWSLWVCVCVWLKRKWIWKDRLDCWMLLQPVLPTVLHDYCILWSCDGEDDDGEDDRWLLYNDLYELQCKFKLFWIHHVGCGWMHAFPFPAQPCTSDLPRPWALCLTSAPGPVKLEQPAARPSWLRERYLERWVNNGKQRLDTAGSCSISQKHFVLKNSHPATSRFLHDPTGPTSRLETLHQQLCWDWRVRLQIVRPSNEG